MAEIKYQIKGTANTGPISATARSVELLSSSASGAQDTMMGLEAAAQGNVTAMFSLAKSVKALWTAIQAGQMAVPLLAALSAAVWALSKAWQWYKQKQEDANTAMEEAGRKMDQLLQRLKELRKPVEIKLNLDKEKRDLDELTARFDHLKKAMQDSAAAGQAGRQAQTAQRLALIDKVAAEDPDQSAGNQMKYDRQRQAVNDAAEAAEIEAQRTDATQRRLLIEREIAALQKQQAPAAALTAAQADVAAKQAAMKNLPRDASVQGTKARVEAGTEYKKAQAELQRITAEEAARQKHISDIIEARQYELDQLRTEQTLINANNAALQARNAAEREGLNLKERQLAVTLADKSASEAKAAADAAAAKARAADANRLAGLQKIAGQAQADYEEKYALATDPAARAAKRKADRETAREQSNWERQVNRAELALERKGGDISKLTPHQRRILEAEEERKLAKGAADAAQALEKKMAEDIGQSRATLEDIRADLQKSLTMT